MPLIGPPHNMTFAVKQEDPTPFNHDLPSLIMWCFKVRALVHAHKKKSLLLLHKN